MARRPVDLGKVPWTVLLAFSIRAFRIEEYKVMHVLLNAGKVRGVLRSNSAAAARAHKAT